MDQPQQTGQPDEQQPWWQTIPMQAGGDIIMAQVGAKASNVAVGKNITQAVYSTLGPPQPDDKQVIEQKIAQLSAALEQLQGQDPAKTQMAQFQVKVLQGELTKTGKDETPSANTIVQIGNWLLDEVPAIAETLVSLFASPPVGRVVGKAGEIAVKWLRSRMGGQGTAPKAT